MKFKYLLILERDGKQATFYPVVTFAKREGTYGNGYSMKVDNCGLGPGNVFDCRYDTRLHQQKLNEFFPVFARGRWDGEEGAAFVVKVEEIIEQ